MPKPSLTQAASHGKTDGSADPRRRWSPFSSAALLLCGAATVGVFFRDFLNSHGNLVAGDTGDGRFNTAILEHWRAVVLGHASFTSPNFFWPEHGVLGYSDSLFLMAVPYVGLRSLGFDYYLAFETVLILFGLIGFFSMFWLLDVFARVSGPVAVFGAALFTLSNLYYLSVGHAQLLTVGLVPLFCVLVMKYWQAENAGKGRAGALYVSLAAILLALMLFTSFYIGWFTTLTGSAILIVTLVTRMLLAGSLAPALEWMGAIQARRKSLALGLAAFGIAIGPFVMTYVPVLKYSGGRSFAEVLNFSAEPVDLINVGPANYMWSKRFSPLLARLDTRFAAGEKSMGWPPFTLLVFLAGTVVGCVRVWRRRTAVSKFVLVPTVLAVTAGILWLLSVKVEERSLWWLVFKLVPGGSAIRVPVRIHLVLNVVLTIVVAFTLEQVIRRRGGRAGQFLGLICGGILLIEQLNATPWHQIQRDQENAILARIKRAPADCRSFLATQPAAVDRPFFAHQIDAMFVARRLDLPTINGYSGWLPPGWEFLVFDDDYMARAQHWAMVKGVADGLCGCDFRSGDWSHIEPGGMWNYRPGTILDFRKNGNAKQFEDQGWGDAEPGGTWTLGDRSILLLKIDPLPEADLLLNVEMHAFTPPQRAQFTDTVSVNGSKLADWPITDRETVIQKQVRIPRALISSKLLRLEFLNHDPRSPAEIGGSTDLRKVGLALHTVILEPVGPGGEAALPGQGTRYFPGTAIDFRAGGNAKQFQAEGWAGAEPGGSWTLGSRSVLLLNLGPHLPTDFSMRIEMHAFTPPQRKRFTDTLTVNNARLTDWVITDEEPAIRKVIRIPGALISSPLVRMEFWNHDPRSPAELGFSVDTRKVGLALETIVLEPVASR